MAGDHGCPEGEANAIAKCDRVPLHDAEFRESWELGLSVCVSEKRGNDDDDDRPRFTLLGFGARPVPGGDNVSVERAVAHILPWDPPPQQLEEQQQLLYLWPGDQSEGFEGYPTESPLAGPFSRLRLAAVLERLGEFLVLAETTTE